MTPAVEAFVEAAFAKYEQRIAELEDQIRLLTDQLRKLSPRGTIRSRPIANIPRQAETQAATWKKLNQGGYNGLNRY